MAGGNDIVGLIAAGVMGLILGSFTGLAAYRLAREQNVFAGAPHCAAASAAPGLRDVLPLLSWLGGHGRCVHCGEPVGYRYPLVEALLAGLFVAVYMVQGPTLTGLLLAALSLGLVILSVVDLEIGIIPDIILVGLAPLGLIYAYAGGVQGFDDVVIALIGGAFAGGVAFAVHYGFKRLRGRDGLGLGDVKYFAVAGLWLGPFGLPAFMIISGVLGIIFALLWRHLGGGKEFPFGPSLAAGLFLCLLFPALTERFS